MLRRLTALAVVLGASAVATAQVPVGNQNTFGRSYPFLNRHAYSTQVDSGRSFPFLNRHAYGTQTDSGIPIPGRPPRQVGSPSPNPPVTIPNAPQQPGASDVVYPFPGYFPGYPVPGYFGNPYGPFYDPFGLYFYRWPLWPGMGWYPPVVPGGSLPPGTMIPNGQQ